MKSRITYPARGMSGFSLIELMVGIVIALVASLAIVQVLSTYEDQKRSTTAGSEAQENGLIALAQLEQDIHNAGAGIADPAVFDCTTIYTYRDSVSGPIPDFSLAPISVTNGTTATASDAIIIRTGASLVSGIPTTLAGTMPPSSSEFIVKNPGVFVDGDLDMVMSGGNCTLQNVTQVQTAAGKIQHNPGNSGPNNPPNSYMNANGWPGYATGSKVIPMGQITARKYSVNNNSLELETTNVASGATSTVVLAKDIVNIQAQYGIAPTGSQIVNAWVNASGGTWAAPTAANIKRIKAIRLVIIARSGKKEGTNVTGTCANNAGTNNGPCAWQDTAAAPAPLIDLSSDADWRKYRYKVYQTVIPLRNVIWANV